MTCLLTCVCKQASLPDEIQPPAGTIAEASAKTTRTIRSNSARERCGKQIYCQRPRLITPRSNLHPKADSPEGSKSPEPAKALQAGKALSRTTSLSRHPPNHRKVSVVISSADSRTPGVAASIHVYSLPISPSFLEGESIIKKNIYSEITLLPPPSYTNKKRARRC